MRAKRRQIVVEGRRRFPCFRSFSSLGPSAWEKRFVWTPQHIARGQGLELSGAADQPCFPPSEHSCRPLANTKRADYIRRYTEPSRCPRNDRTPQGDHGLNRISRNLDRRNGGHRPSAHVVSAYLFWFSRVLRGRRRGWSTGGMLFVPRTVRQLRRAFPFLLGGAWACFRVRQHGRRTGGSNRHGARYISSTDRALDLVAHAMWLGCGRCY
jgi:hypothetical protein